LLIIFHQPGLAQLIDGQLNCIEKGDIEVIRLITDKTLEKIWKISFREKRPGRNHQPDGIDAGKI